MRTTIDVIGAFVALLVLSPLLLIIALLVIEFSPGDPFYRAPRIGKNGRPFRMWKFRTMKLNAAAVGPPVTIQRDPRVTAIGQLLRRTKLDELPQLINVVTGDMSLVGPRPESPEIVAHYSPAQRAVLSVKPGITGKTQLESGDADNIPHGVDATAYYRKHLMGPKLQADLEYLRQRTAISDFRILCSTAALVFRAIVR